MSFNRERDLIHRSGEQASVCDYCGKTFLTGNLNWVTKTWITSDGTLGDVTATLCPECDELALVHCWRCGELTGEVSANQCRRCQLETATDWNDS